MLSWFRRRGEDRQRAIELYGAIVARTREPAFFETLRVEDTPEGRTGLLIALMFPALERLQSGNGRDRRTARLLTETFVTDMDDCLREMGVGDLSVPRKVKRAAQALGERCLAYRRAISGQNPAQDLSEQLAGSVPGLDRFPSGARSLATDILASVAALAAVPAGSLTARHVAQPALSALP